ncbi:MAG TPA: SDR family NAD(P)-dependent oxidoreductase [Spirochaetota bacterium]|nr:SDR family NAD(P)-dependent oxidoreductase [Spirochaetota bacterium]HOF14457.1 SDR family NAD(P)-dependent oxidoreductase [Spirochaetota bacterium]HOM86419.1 SDR family NAD(P)-dependent oxidoreductase [Spirochaetota bacterium]HOR93073.1 SDR family NAD(P)-dependent oxidoreductase [Spirochaetota bacterium]HOT18422.1 SDR family NAD(P)-dependent oxidoreductase [Spirochaetota bacterium]
MDITNKRVLLTGGSSGIGKAMIDELHGFNTSIVVGDLNPEAIQHHTNTTAMYCDVSKQKDIDTLFNKAITIMGGVDLCIANAGFAYYEKIESVDYQHIQKIVAVNYIAPIYCLEKMMEINKGKKFSVAFTASAMAKLPLPGYALYSATKAALDGFAHSFNFEKDSSVHLLIVYPIATETKFFATAGNNIPVPFPTQTPEKVAKEVIKGLQKEKRYVFPSKLFRGMMVVNRFLPFVLYGYAKVEHYKLKKWLSVSKGQ